MSISCSISAPSGNYLGFLTPKARIFRGIVYATYERFEEAKGVYKNSGTVDCTHYGALCPQQSERINKMLGTRSDRPTVEEGKLCLSIYTPLSEGPHPVMVWIHGGSFIQGGSEDPRYGCERLVEASGAVIVKISYRLGAQGWLWMPERGIANLGLKDQIEALRWIRRNIKAFGGDETRITVFGQSAGALSVAALIDKGCAKNYFDRAIIQSAPFGIKMTGSQAAKIRGIFLKELQELYPNYAGDDYSLLKTASQANLLKAQAETLKRKLHTGMSFMPVNDKPLSIPDGLMPEACVVGYNAQDASPFLGDSPSRLATYLTTRYIFAKPAGEYARLLESKGCKLFRYVIGWYPEGNPMRACHSIELPFLLGEKSDWSEARMLEGITKEEWAHNSKCCLRSWAAFANGSDFPELGL